jgi:hypothetical protein
MRFDNIMETKIEALEIQYFLEDPDDDPYRFGDGHYYRPPGEATWNGPWHGAGECRQMYRAQLEFYYRSLERKLAIYDKEPRSGTSRYLLEFDGILDPLAFDVHFFLWIVGPGHPSPMNAVIDAAAPADITARLEGTVLVYGDVRTTEVSGTIDDICGDRGLPHPSTGPSSS